jgi:type I restriction enzyme, R subunit
VKVKIKLADGKERTIQHMVANTFWSPDGKPMSAAQFVERLFGELPELFRDEEELRILWGNPDTRRKLLEGLEEKGFGKDQLEEIRNLIEAEQSDLFDVLAYIAFALPTMTREKRVEASRSTIHRHYSDTQQEFLDFVLTHYIAQRNSPASLSEMPYLFSEVLRRYS